MRLSLILIGAMLAIPAFSGQIDYVKEGRVIRQRIAAHTEAARANAKAAAAFRTEEYDAVGADGTGGQPQFKQIRFLRPDLALVDGSLAGGSYTWVMEKRDGAWLIAASRQASALP